MAAARPSRDARTGTIYWCGSHKVHFRVGNDVNADTVDEDLPDDDLEGDARAGGARPGDARAGASLPGRQLKPDQRDVPQAAPLLTHAAVSPADPGDRGPGAGG